jgi:nucleoid-associated protein YgaU
MKKRIIVLVMAGIFLSAWLTCAAMIGRQQVRMSPASRTAWTLKVVKMVDHIVKKGESLSKIASSYGVALEDILQANGIENPDDLKAGEKIKIPMKKVKEEVLI